MVSCSEFLAEFGNYMDGEAGADLRRELEAHLAHCRTCQVILDSTRKTLKIVTESGELDLSEPLPEPLVVKIMEKVRSRQSGDSDDSMNS